MILFWAEVEDTSLYRVLMNMEEDENYVFSGQMKREEGEGEGEEEKEE
jgi:hypothetical protein